MKLTKILLLSAGLLLSGHAFAQMEFSFSGITGIKTSVQQDGSTLVQMPSGTNLNSFGTLGMSAKVDGQSVNLSDIHPNPSTTFITDGEIETFVYDGKAYSFRFTEGAYFTAVIFSDPHIEQTDYEGCTVATMQSYVNNMVNMGKEGGKTYTFSKAPGYIPKADIVFCLGDMDKDSESSGSNFKDAMQGFNTAGIPFITLAGNHDLVPDYWGADETSDKGLTSGLTGGSACNDVALKIVTDQRNTAVTNGISNVQVFNDGTGHTQANPFAFTFGGVRFYCGQTYWFQKPYSGSFTEVSGTTISSATYYAPDGVIDALNNYVTDEVAAIPSVWMQHYPLVAGSDCDRWWEDKTSGGATIAPSDETVYTNAKSKKDKLAGIINRTKNPVHFSGHIHDYATNTYAGITDYSVAAPGKVEGAAYIVLFKENVGVVEVKQVSFK